MNKIKTELRVFAMSTDKLLSLSKIFIGNFAIDKTDFIIKITDLADPFYDNWSLCMQEVENIKLDEDFIDEQQLLTYEINKMMISARDLLQIIYFYVDRSFGKDEAINTYFGRNEYLKARTKPLLLTKLILKCCEAANRPEYHPQLTAKGLSQIDIEQTIEIANKINLKVVERDKLISSRKLLTQERIAGLNTLYNYLAAVSEASKLVYKNDYSKYQQYLLYNGRKCKPRKKKSEINKGE